MKKMDKMFNLISLTGGFLGGVVAFLFGGWDKLLMAMVILVALDYITGIFKGIKKKELSSEIGFVGIIRKIIIFIVIATAYCIQSLINDSIPLREIVITFYICNEAMSLLENAAEFVPIPEKLKNVLIQIRDKEAKENSMDGYKKDIEQGGKV